MSAMGAPVGAWRLSLQGALSAMYTDQSTQRGDRQTALTDWEMLMASRRIGAGFLRLSLMTSIEPFVLGGNGYAELLQSGGTYLHSYVHDRQHPHEALMEVAAAYERTLTPVFAASIYGGPVGEPALGPVSFMHRQSAGNDPVAPLGHHWQDAAHGSFGVVTLGFRLYSIKLEGSAFNAREPDEHHLVVDYRGARLDSYAGRLTWTATPRTVASAWWGFLNEHDRLDPTTRMHRYGASIATEAHGPGGGRWSSSLIWGMNLHHHGAASHELIHGGPGASPHHASNSVLAESSLDLGRRNTVFVRAERVQKNGEELGFQGGDLTTLYDIRSVVGGLTHRVATLGIAELALGARGAVNFIPPSLLLTYRTRTPVGLTAFVQLRASGGK